MTRAGSVRASELALLGVPVVVVVIAVAAIAGRGQDPSTIGRLPQLSPVLEIINIVAGISVIAAGALAWIAGRRAAGLAAMLAGLCWFGSDLAGNAGAAPALRAAGLVAVTLTLPTLGLAVVVAIPPASSSVARTGLVLSVVAMAVLAVLWLVAWVPALDPRCLAICDANPLGAGFDFLLARSLANGWQGLTVITGVGIAAWAIRALSSASRPTRRQRGPLLLAATLVGAAWAAWGMSLMLPSTVVAPAGGVAAVAFAARGLAMIAFAVGLGWLIVNIQQTLVAVRRLADRVAPFPAAGSLRAGLAEALGDPGLRLVYVLPGDAGYVQADGQAAETDPSSMPSDRRTEIRVGDEVVAVAVRSPEAPGEIATPSFGPAVQLAADNERLLAAVRHDVIELQASRSRIVATGDEARRRLERNLHDGAQQRMLGIVHDLAVARELAIGANDPRAGPIDAAVGAADDTIDALRALARGIHPAILEEAGLAAALEVIGDEAPLPVLVEQAPDGRFAPAAESAVLRVVTWCVVEGAGRGATSARVAVAVVDDRLGVRVAIDGLAEPLETTALEDVVGAMGGRLHTAGPVSGTMRLEADLPCG